MSIHTALDYRTPNDVEAVYLTLVCPAKRCAERRNILAALKKGLMEDLLTGRVPVTTGEDGSS